jgi:hypothetical protein
MKLTRFDPPADVDDVGADAGLRKRWSDRIARLFQQGVHRTEQTVGAGNSQFYDPMRTDTDDPVATAVISWPGFPRLLLLKHGPDKRAAFKEGDQLVGNVRQQDEYLEWHVRRNAAGKIVRIDFTCEGPEYWDFLADEKPARVLELYRQHVSPDVQDAEIFPGGHYDPLNRWNTTDGAMHLIQPNNTLSAEIFIAADATVLRRKNGQLLTDADALIECAKYGEAGRASDPRIGSKVNELARQGFAITLANPVGLYLERPNSTTWKKPDGTPVKDYFRVVRGTESAGLRAVYEVPAGETSAGQPFVVGDITIGGKKIEFGGQVAEQVTVKLTGIACRQGSFQNAPHGCVGLVPAAIVGGAGAGFATRRRAG